MGTVRSFPIAMLLAAALTSVGCNVGNSDSTCASGQTCTCSGIGNCTRDCPSGGCHFRCTGTGNCAFTCAGGNCDLSCANTGNCTFDCTGCGCSIDCTQSTPQNCIPTFHGCSDGGPG